MPEYLGLSVNRNPRTWGGRFTGERVNLEHVPRLPASVVAYVLAEGRVVRLRWVPYCPDWQGEAATVHPEEGAVLVRRTRGEWAAWPVRVEVERRPLPRRGGQALLLRCPECSRPVRHLYAWARTGDRRVRLASWPCHRCAGLRYVSEGDRNPWSAFAGPRARAPWDPEEDTPPAHGGESAKPLK